MKIIWVEFKNFSRRFGHGVEFYTSEPKPGDKPLAFLDGYEWLHGDPETVEIMIRTPDSDFDADFHAVFRQTIERCMTSGGLNHGRLSSSVFAWFNA